MISLAWWAPRQPLASHSEKDRRDSSLWRICCKGTLSIFAPERHQDSRHYASRISAAPKKCTTQRTFPLPRERYVTVSQDEHTANGGGTSCLTLPDCLPFPNQGILRRGPNTQHYIVVVRHFQGHVKGWFGSKGPRVSAVAANDIGIMTELTREDR